MVTTPAPESVRRCQLEVLPVRLEVLPARALGTAQPRRPPPTSPSGGTSLMRRPIAQGAEGFRYDTFGSEAFFGSTIGLHQAIAGEKFGGVGPGVSPRTALAV